jgi:hypothetical protein
MFEVRYNNGLPIEAYCPTSAVPPSVPIISFTKTSHRALEPTIWTRYQETTVETITTLRQTILCLDGNKPLITVEDISRLRGWPANWEGFDSVAPSEKAIEHAISYVYEIHQAVFLTAGLNWKKPHVTANSEGDVVFEWWQKEHDLTLYISDKQVEYVKAWGVNIHSEMEDGCIDSIKTFLDLWKWLIS